MNEYGIDYDIAEKFFGWKWIAYDGTPVRSAPGYPKECRVKRFFSPETLANQNWGDHLKKSSSAAPVGDEALDYAYESTMHPQYPPQFSSDWNAVAKLEHRIREINIPTMWFRYRELLWAEIKGTGAIEEYQIACAGKEYRCAAAMALDLPKKPS